MTRSWAAGKSVLLSAVCAIFFSFDASAADCRWFQRNAQRAIKEHVTALQRIEHEASDRTKGLDTRPFDLLLADARKATTIIVDPAALEDEKGLERCRNRTHPIRAICAASAQALIGVLEKHLAVEKPEFDRKLYADGAAACEKHMDLKPLKSVLRGTE